MATWRQGFVYPCSNHVAAEYNHSVLPCLDHSDFFKNILSLKPEVQFPHVPKQHAIDWYSDVVSHIS